MALTEGKKIEIRADFGSYMHRHPLMGHEIVDLYMSELRENLYFEDDDVKEVDVRDLVKELAPKAPIYILVDAVAEAIREYDKSKDHLRHGAGSDCIRCRLEDVIHNMYAGKPIRPGII